MADTQTSQPDYDSIAQQAYEWLKKRRAKGEISTFEVLMKINGYKWGSKELEQLEELDLFEVHGRLLRLIKKGKEYVADFSAYEGMYIGLPYNIPKLSRKNRYCRDLAGETLSFVGTLTILSLSLYPEI